MSCKCGLINTLRDNDAALYTRQNLVAVIIDNDTWRGLYRCKTCQTWFEETFEEARFVDIPILKKVDEEYIRTHWGILNINCDSCRKFGEITGFHSISEFERFLNYLEDNIKGGKLTEVPVENRYAGFQEQWFRCNQCNQVWRLVHPDFPFKGFWRLVLK